MSDIIFTELQQDAIVELVNMGIGKAAEALSQIIHDEVHLSVPHIEFVHHDDLLEYMRKIDNQTPSAVMQTFTGDFSGSATLIFPGSSGMSLVRQMLQGTINPEGMEELEEEALTEIGNIILNACFGQLGNLLSTDLDGALPSYLRSSAEEILDQTEMAAHVADDGQTMLLQVDFSLNDNETKGFVMFTMNVDSLVTFRDKVDLYLNKIFG